MDCDIYMFVFFVFLMYNIFMRNLVVDEKYDKDKKILVVLDNHSVHRSKKTNEYLETRKERFEVVFTPKHGSWLNIIEGFFGKLARQLLRGIRVKSK